MKTFIKRLGSKQMDIMLICFDTFSKVEFLQIHFPYI